MKIKINTSMRHLAIACALASYRIDASAEVYCSGYTIGFFNGVWNTQTQAAESLKVLKKIRGTSFNGEPIQYEEFYNHTGSTADSSPLLDIAETFEQRAAEIDASGELGKRWELFWEGLTGERTLLDKIFGIVPDIGSLVAQLYTDMTTRVIGSFADLLSNPPTNTDYAAHNSRLDALASQGQKLVLVAHSQGNLFVNHAYDHIAPIIGANSVGVAHIAPASTTLRGDGDWLLTSIDLVINGLRIQGLSSVPENNLSMLPSFSDVTGHTLVGTYLDAARTGREKVDQLITTAMQSLVTPNKLGRYLAIDPDEDLSNGADCSVIKDTVTQLEWMRCSAGQTWNQQNNSCDGPGYRWPRPGNPLGVDGFLDAPVPAGWRIPNISELRSLVYCSSGSPVEFGMPLDETDCGVGSRVPTIYQAAFPNTPSWGFWSNTPSATFEDFWWITRLDKGQVNSGGYQLYYHLRFVRGG